MVVLVASAIIELFTAPVVIFCSHWQAHTYIAFPLFLTFPLVGSHSHHITVCLTQLQVTISNTAGQSMDEDPVTVAEEPASMDEAPVSVDEIPVGVDEVAVNADEEVLVSLDDDMDERILLAPDEEEEEDDETRSWRR